MAEERIGVYVCCCGTNIAKVVDVESLAEEMKDLQGVSIARTYKYMCSNPGQQMITDDIKEHNLSGSGFGMQPSHAREHLPQGPGSRRC
jgi:heterodisulfide reductase subunit A